MPQNVPSEQTASILLRSPKPDQETGLIDFFANNFTCTGMLSSRSNLFWVPSNFHNLLADESAKSSVLAASAMALARLQRPPYYLREAQTMYGTAVLSLNAHWQTGVAYNKEAVYLCLYHS